MKQPKYGEAWLFRDLEPETQNEILQHFLNEVAEFRNWMKTVPFKRKESFFWESDYGEQLFLDVATELIFENFNTLESLPVEVINEILFLIARNHEQGNILAWKDKKTEISYLKMNKKQFQFLAKEIVKRGESSAKFQVAFIFRKFELISKAEEKLIEQLTNDSDENVRRQSSITLEKFKK